MVLSCARFYFFGRGTEMRGPKKLEIIARDRFFEVFGRDIHSLPELFILAQTRWELGNASE